MADITMCKGTNCPLKEECYRFKAIPNEYRQSMLITVPYNHETEKCDRFWKNEEE